MLNRFDSSFIINQIDNKKVLHILVVLITANTVSIGDVVTPFYMALCQMLGYSPYESSLAPIIVMVGAILFAQK